MNSALLRQSTPRCSDCWPKDECSRAQLPLDLKVVDTNDKGRKTFSDNPSRMIFIECIGALTKQVKKPSTDASVKRDQKSVSRAR